MQYQTVLCYLEKDNKYLMLYRNKKEFDINHNKYIGVGGHVEKNETIEEALNREVKEETGLTLNSYEYKGLIIFYLDNDVEICYTYTSNDFKGEIIPCNEGELKWVEISKLNDLELWEGDRIFLPLLKNKKTFKLKLVYKEGKLISSQLKK